MRSSTSLLAIWTAQGFLGCTCYCLNVDLGRRIDPRRRHPSSPATATARNKQQKYPIIPIQSDHSLHATIPQWDGELSEEDQDMIRLIRGPIMDGTVVRKPRSILILSDTTGITAKAAVEKAMAQFNGCDERFVGVFTSEDDGCENLTTRMFPFVRTEAEVAELLRTKVQDTATSLVIFTFADPALRARTARMCELSDLRYVDLLGRMFDALSDFLQRKPMGAFSLEAKPTKRSLSDDYFRRIDAVEFTLKCDDGCHPELMSEADVILTGVSRTGKTPLSVYLAQTMGLRVSNVPLVVDLDPPQQLLSKVNPKRVFCLLLDIADLHKIRRTRLQGELKGRAKNEYADKQYLRRDLKHARELAVEYGFTEIDVSNRAVEETASFIRSLLKERFGE